MAPELLRLTRKRRDGRIEELQRVEIVEGDDRDVRGNLEPEGPYGAEETEEDVIAARDDGGRSIRRRQHPRGRGLAELRGERAVLDHARRPWLDGAEAAQPLRGLSSRPK